MSWRGLQTHILLQKGGGHTLYRKRVAGGDLRPPVPTLLPSETWWRAVRAVAGVGYVAPGRGGGYGRVVRGDVRLVSTGTHAHGKSRRQFRMSWNSGRSCGKFGTNLCGKIFRSPFEGNTLPRWCSEMRLRMMSWHGLQAHTHVTAWQGGEG